jgi:aldose 1-epimerase
VFKERGPFKASIVVVAVFPIVAAGTGPRPMALVKDAVKRPSVTRGSFGYLPDGRVVELFTLTNAQRVEVRAINYGGIIVSLKVPDRKGRLDDVVLGYDDLQGYLRNPAFFGAIIGRYANRIAKGRFEIDGKVFPLSTNDGPNHLHGGRRGFDKMIWNAEVLKTKDGVGVMFTRTSPDGEEGYPGRLDVRVTYTLNDRNELVFEYFATTDQPTPVNLTQHSYFNLAGDGRRDVLGHELIIEAGRFTPVDGGLIPTGELTPVAGTPMDFRNSIAIGARITQDDVQLRRGRGYDHNFVLTRNGDGLSRAVRVLEPTTGRTLEVLTTEPGLQFYSGNFLDGSITGKRGHVYRHRFGFCLETQHFPNSPNQPAFRNTILRPGQEYRSKTVLVFGVQRLVPY